MELDEIRENIDKTDDKIVELFVRRMELSALVAKNKKESGAQIRCAAREEEIIRRLDEKIPPELSEYLKQLYKEVFAISRDYQRKLTDI